MITVNASIVRNTPIAADIFDMAAYAPAFFNGTGQPPAAGQFMMLYVDKGEHMLPRPISICETMPEEKIVRFIYKNVGKGTAHLASLRPSASIRLTGPLGRGFSVDLLTGNYMLVGGGVGAPPLLLLAKTLRELEPSSRITAVLGFADEVFLIEDFARYCDEVHVATDSGRTGFHGNALDLCKRCASDNARICACGPRPLLSALAAWALPRGIPLQLSMEERMACGYGACVGCAIAIKQKNGTVYKRVCKDGPVFDGRQVVFNER